MSGERRTEREEVVFPTGDAVYFDTNAWNRLLDHPRSAQIRVHLQRTNVSVLASIFSAVEVANTRDLECRGAMGIAAGAGVHRPAPRPLRCLRARTRRPTFPPGDLPSGCFSNQNWQEPLRTTSRVFRGKFLIPERLAPAGSFAAVRFPAPGSPGPPRSETSARGAIRKRVDFSNLNRRPSGRDSGSLRASAPGNSHCVHTGSDMETV